MGGHKYLRSGGNIFIYEQSFSSLFRAQQIAAARNQMSWGLLRYCVVERNGKWLIGYRRVFTGKMRGGKLIKPKNL